MVRLFPIIVCFVLATAVCPADAAPVPYKMLTIHQGKAGQWKARATYPQFHGSSPVVVLANATIRTAVRKSVRDFARVYKSEPHEGALADIPFDQSSQAKITLADTRLISAYSQDNEYTGGAHGNTGYAVYNIGYKNGKPKVLTLQDLFKPEVNAVTVASDLVMLKLRANPDASEVQEGNIKEITPLMAKQFVLTRSGITFIFEPYSVAAYAVGTIFVKIPYSAFGDYLDLDGPLQGVIPR